MMVSGVGRGIGALDGVVIVEREGAVLWVNVGRPIEINGDCCVVVRERRTLPKLLWEHLLVRPVRVARYRIEFVKFDLI